MFRCGSRSQVAPSVDALSLSLCMLNKCWLVVRQHCRTNIVNGFLLLLECLMFSF